MRWKFSENQSEVSVVLERIENDTYTFSIDGRPIVISRSDANLMIESWSSQEWRVATPQSSYLLKPLSLEKNQKGGGNQIFSQMPGKVLKLLVKEGDSVNSGQSLLIIEAMKMENEIRSEKNAKVKKVHIPQGSSVESGALLLELEDLTP